MPRIWVVDDDPEQQQLLSFILARDGFQVECFGDGRDLLDALEQRVPDLLLLDIGLPEVGGLEVLQQVRANPRLEAMPIIMLTASRQVSVRYVSLAAGVDDFLTKPVDHLELVLRVKTRLRAAEVIVGGAAHALVPAGSPAQAEALVQLDIKLREVTVGDRRASLTPSEFAVLRYLMERPGEPVNVETLLVEALDYPPKVGSPETVRNHLRNLRAKVEDDPAAPRFIVNVPRVGYMFKPDGAGR